MFSYKVNYTDYRGNERERELFFHFNEAELHEMTFSVDGGLDVMVNKIIEAQNTPEIIKIFKDLLLKSYGEISPNGDQFIKSDELRQQFEQSEAYSIMYMKLGTDDKFAAQFINGILPADIRKKVDELSKKNENNVIGIPNATTNEVNA